MKSYEISDEEETETIEVQINWRIKFKKDINIWVISTSATKFGQFKKTKFSA